MNSKLVIFVVLSLLAINLSARPLNPKKVLYAINCGSS
jgi:hypothetical protein